VQEPKIISRKSRGKFAVVPYRDYLQLREAWDDRQDFGLLEEAKNDPDNQQGRPLEEYLAQRKLLEKVTLSSRNQSQRRSRYWPPPPAPKRSK
jgi:hypothetical protein